MLLYIGIIAEIAIKDYQGSLETYRAKYIIKRYILKNRFQQLNRFFYATKPQIEKEDNKHAIFNRVGDLSKHLQLLYYQLYYSRTYLAINKTIKRFTSRALEIVNIPTKLMPEGFKIWVLGN